MLTLTREIHGIDAETLRAYLSHLAGEKDPGDLIVGQEWKASISQLPDYRIGQTSFCSFLVKIEGEKEVVETIMRRFELRIMRPGG